MALTAKLLHLRPKCRPISNPSFIRFFSDEPNSNPNTTTSADATSSPSQSQSQSSLSSYFSDVKASLKRQASPPPPRRPFNPSSSSSSSSSYTARTNQTPPSRIESLEEIRRNLAEFRRRAAAPLPSAPSSGGGKPPSSSPAAQPVSLEEVYKLNVMPKGENNQPPGGKFSFEAIRESLQKLKPSATKNQAGGVDKRGDLSSLSRVMESFKRKPGMEDSPSLIGGRDKLPISVFGKEMGDKKEEDRDKDAMRTEFLKMYSYDELGEKLRMLRPEKKGEKSWFTLAELNERLIKLREYEEKESESRIGGVSFKDIRESLHKLKSSEDEKNRTTMMQRIDVLGQIGGTPSFMLSPPKEHLVETYFHPDNMSSAEKLKLELKKVRDEFKMKESDCGSARVQVAQLTTKIKHLSSVLHKKDKHSRKGLLAMVQRRKKLLKYLRRTDWDSYCLVLSKLGLRDNPDLKN